MTARHSPAARPAAVQSIDISWPTGPQQQTRSGRTGQTDRRTDGRAAVMNIMRAVPIIISTIVIDWATPTSARSALAKLLLLLLYC